MLTVPCREDHTERALGNSMAVAGASEQIGAYSVSATRRLEIPRLRWWKDGSVLERALFVNGTRGAGKTTLLPLISSHGRRTGAHFRGVRLGNARGIEASKSATGSRHSPDLPCGAVAADHTVRVSWELQADEVRSKRVSRVELEADDGVAVESFGESAQGVGAAAVLTAFDSGDHRLRGAHPLR